MPLLPIREASASFHGPSTSQANSERRGQRFVQQRATPRGHDVGQSDGDAFDHSRGSVLGRLRTTTRPNRLTRRCKERIAVPEGLRSEFSGQKTLNIETQERDDGSVEVVDCAFIASSKELRRWRLSLEDFHALIVGGKESIEAYRQTQRNRDAAADVNELHVEDAEEAIRADELALKKSSQVTAANTPVGTKPGSVLDQEPTWRKVIMWPWRALCRLWHAIVSWVG